MIKNVVKNLEVSSTLRINEISKELESQGKKLFKFGFGQSPFKIPEDVVNELKNKELELSVNTDPALFKNEYEKKLYKKIHELRKYFTSINKDEDYELTLKNLAESKQVIFDFFDNVKVNDEDKTIQKNRLELIQMLCKTFDNYINFSIIEST